MQRIQSLKHHDRAYQVRFDPELLKPLQQDYLSQLAPLLLTPEVNDMLTGQYYYSQALGRDYYLFSYDTYPLFWLTNHTQRSYRLFADFFDALKLEAKLENLIRFKRKLVMYCGFFVVGNRATERMWHYDYRPNAQGVTLITPLFEWNEQHGHLLYQDLNSNEHRYTYTLGQALLLGPGFLHSTEPYAPSSSLRVLVSMTLGSDRWQDWPVLKQNIAEQSYLYALPCGHLVDVSCRCEQKHQFRRRWWPFKIDR